MTPLEYRDALKRLGLSVEGAAKLLGIPEITSRKRAQGITAIPREAAMLLRLMLALKIDPSEALRLTASGSAQAGGD